MTEHGRDYTTVNIPNHLAEKVREVMKGAGYQNLAEFARDAVRRRLEEIERRAQ